MRQCGECQLCCKILPVKSIGKPALRRCAHARFGKGCAVYTRRPESCRLWDCLWLRGDDVAELRRPDRLHLIVDMIPDYITLQPHEDPENSTNVGVLQIWADPAAPEAHRDPLFRTWLNRRREIAIVRFGSKRAFVLCPPSRSAAGIWEEAAGTWNERPEMEQMRALTDLGYEFKVEVDADAQ